MEAIREGRGRTYGFGIPKVPCSPKRKKLALGPLGPPAAGVGTGPLPGNGRRATVNAHETRQGIPCGADRRVTSVAGVL